MSVLLENAAEELWKLGATPAQFTALMCFAKHGNWQSGETFITQKTVSEKTGVARSTVNEAIRWAEEAGLLSKTVRSSNGSRTIFDYTFRPELLEPNRKAAGKSQATRGTSQRNRRFVADQSTGKSQPTQNSLSLPPELTRHENSSVSPKTNREESQPADDLSAALDPRKRRFTRSTPEEMEERRRREAAEPEKVTPPAEPARVSEFEAQEQKRIQEERENRNSRR